MRLLRLQQVRDLTGLSRSSIYAAPDFPKPIKISARSVAWIEAEICEWISARIALRESA